MRLLRTRTKRIAELTDGNAEIAGTIRAVGDAVTPPSGRKCVYVYVEVAGMRGKGKQRSTVHSERVERVVDAKVEASVSGYRDGVPVEKNTFVFGGAAKARMIVSEGSEAELLWRATWPVLVLAATSTSAFLFAALVIQLMRA